MDDSSDEVSALAQRAEALAAEKHRREEMLIVRKTFREPMVERDRPPRWVTLLQEKKVTVQATEKDALSGSRWTSCLDRQQWAMNRNSQNSGAGQTSTIGTSSRSKQLSSKSISVSQQYMSSWLRQLHSEIERKED